MIELKNKYFVVQIDKRQVSPDDKAAIFRLYDTFDGESNLIIDCIHPTYVDSLIDILNKALKELETNTKVFTKENIIFDAHQYQMK